MIDIKRDVEAFLASKEDPIKFKKILTGIGLNNGDRQYLKSVLKTLVKEGKVVKRDTFYWLPEGKQRSRELKREKTRGKKQMTGTLTIAAKGYGFVGASIGVDWFIPSHALNNAKHGDLVRAQTVETGKNGRIVGEVIHIESFGKQVLLGVFEKHGGETRFFPFEDYVVDRRDLLGFPADAEDGMVAVWHREDSGKWRFARYLGDFSDPGIDERIVVEENEIVTTFSEEVQAEVRGLSQDFAFELGKRKDFRDETVFTVDGASARDFDDALHIKMLKGGSFEVGIHIADVSAFVVEGSKLDSWARDQGNSVYLPHKAFPMLPEILSNELCSLKPEVPRYTLSVVVRLSREGKVESYRIYKGLIRSKYRLTYDEVAAIGIERDETIREKYQALVPVIDLGLEISRKLMKRRARAGGLGLDLAEMSLTLDENQELASAELIRQNDANRLIEAFMCLANECIARHMAESGIGIPFRIHQPPEAEKLETFAALLKLFGYAAPDDLTQNPGRALNHIIKMVAGGPSGRYLQTQVLRTLKIAEYKPTNLGHFGLGSSCYTHFTSPIRRCADLVLHQRLSRLLADPSLGPEFFDDRELGDLCAHISKKERSAMKAEQGFVKLKVLRHLARDHGQTLSGTVTEVKAFGLFVELDDWPISGLVRVDRLGDDFYDFNPEALALVGKRTRKQLKPGLAVQVKINRVDLVGRKLDLDLAGYEGTEQPFRPRAKSVRPSGPLRRGRRETANKSSGRGKTKSRRTKKS